MVVMDGILLPLEILFEVCPIKIQTGHTIKSKSQVNRLLIVQRLIPVIVLFYGCLMMWLNQSWCLFCTMEQNTTLSLLLSCK
jgi:hypothetical protein